jgi:undecaprenyl diphosphate synthase
MTIMSSSINHIAFIPDGNRRWAKDLGLPSLEGHHKGYDLVSDLADWCFARGIQEMSVWGFSTENWKRKKEEVGYLMDLCMTLLTRDLKKFHEKGVRLRVIGRREDLSPKLQQAIEHAEELTRNNTKGVFNLCFNYGGRPEIISAVKQCLEEGVDPADLDDETFAEKLWSAEMSDIDLIVRTSGEQRLSGFMPWKGGYSELYFANMHWPDFSEAELDVALAWFENRNRRFGGDAVR